MVFMSVLLGGVQQHEGSTTHKRAACRNAAGNKPKLQDVAFKFKKKKDLKSADICQATHSSHTVTASTPDSEIGEMSCLTLILDPQSSKSLRSFDHHILSYFHPENSRIQMVIQKISEIPSIFELFCLQFVNYHITTW